MRPKGSGGRVGRRPRVGMNESKSELRLALLERAGERLLEALARGEEGLEEAAEQHVEDRVRIAAAHKKAHASRMRSETRVSGRIANGMLLRCARWHEVSWSGYHGTRRAQRAHPKGYRAKQ